MATLIDGLLLWTVAALFVGIVIGKGIRKADQMQAQAGSSSRPRTVSLVPCACGCGRLLPVRASRKRSPGDRQRGGSDTERRATL